MVSNDKRTHHAAAGMAGALFAAVAMALASGGSSVLAAQKAGHGPSGGPNRQVDKPSTSTGSTNARSPSSTGSATGGSASAGGSTSTSGSSSASGTDTTSTSSDGTTLETKAELAVDIFTGLKKAPSATGTSPYVDVKATSPQWGYVKLALQYGMLKPDTKHRFGADDPVLGATLALAMAHLYGVPTSSTWTASQWIEASGLMASPVVESNLTHAQVLAFLSALPDWSAGQKAFPRSWTLTAPQSQGLLQALANTAEAQQYQMNLTQTQSGQLVLTPSGKQNSTYVQLAAAQAKQTDVLKTAIQSSTTNGQPVVLTTVQDTNSGKVTNQIQYLTGSTLYVSNGKAWSSGTVSTTELANLKGIASNLTLSGFIGVSAGAPANGQTMYSMTLQPATVRQVISGILQSAGLQSNPTLIAQYLKDTTVTLTLTTETVQNSLRITNQSLHLQVHIPGGDFNTMTGGKLSQSDSQAFASAVKEYDESVTLDAAITYNNTAIAPPKGLPAK